MSTENKIRTRILIISDTHSALPDPEAEYPFSKPLPKADVAIHCGDLTSTGKLYQHERALTLLKALPAALKIVIPGNHDLTLDPEYCSTHTNRQFHGVLEDRAHIADAYDLYTNDAAKQAGIVYLTEGTRTFHLDSGANLTVYASAYTPEFSDWSFAYPRSIDRFNKDNGNLPEDPVPDHDWSEPSINIMMTHGPPLGILDTTHRQEHVGCEHLRRAVERCRPQLHCFGHIHEAWGSVRRQWSPSSADIVAQTSPIEQGLEHVGYVDGTQLLTGKDTIFVNASIMDLKYRPSQRPWVVDLMLSSCTDENSI